MSCVQCLQLFNVKVVVQIVTTALERFKYKM